MSFAESFIGALGGTGVAVATLGYLGRNLLENRLKKDLEDHIALKRDWENQRKIELSEQADVRATVKKYGRIILIAASDLQDRLWHLCERQASARKRVLLESNEHAPVSGAWPMTKHHYLTSTVYLFAHYLFWIGTLKQQVRLLEFTEDRNTEQFNYHLKRVERMLAETDLQRYAEQRISTDKPIFQLMQSEIGESLRLTDAGSDRCRSYHEFRCHYADLLSDYEGLQRLEALLLGAMSDAPSNFCLRRLKLLCNALLDLVVFLHQHNRLKPAEGLEAVPVPDFDYEQFLGAWPVTLDQAKPAGGPLGS